MIRTEISFVSWDLNKLKTYIDAIHMAYDLDFKTSVQIEEDPGHELPPTLVFISVPNEDVKEFP